MSYWKTIISLVAVLSLFSMGCSGGDGKSDLVKKGRRLYVSKGCNTCHSTNEAKMVGPSFKGIYGKREVVLVDGKEQTITIDDAYIRESIENPDAKITKGYKKGTMILPQVVKPDEIDALIAFIKSLK